MTTKLTRSARERLARKYWNRASDTLFGDAPKFKANGMERFVQLAKEIHNAQCKLARALEEYTD